MDQEPQGPGPNSPDQAILMMRIIGASLGTGVTFFAFVSWFLHQQDSGPASGFDTGLLFNGFVALMLITGLGALFVWRTRVAPVIEQSAEEDRWQTRASAIQSGLILAWALVEGAALFGEVIYFLTGFTLAGVLGVLLIWGAVGLTWPRRDWL